MAEVALKRKRPKNLDLLTIRQPLPAILSILHRVSGAVLFLFIPLLLCILQSSLASEKDFIELKAHLANPLIKIVLTGLIWAYAHHFCAGIRFLLLDMHIGIDLPSCRASAKAIFIVSIPLALIIAGVLVW